MPHRVHVSRTRAGLLSSVHPDDRTASAPSRRQSSASNLANDPRRRPPEAQPIGTGTLSGYLLSDSLLLPRQSLAPRWRSHLQPCPGRNDRRRERALGRWYVPPISFRLREVEGEIILTPDHQQAWLLLAHPGLPCGISVDVGAIVVKQVALNVGLPRLTEKGRFIGPEIRVIAFHVGIVPDMARPRGWQRQEICAKRAFVGSAISPKRPPCLPTCR